MIMWFRVPPPHPELFLQYPSFPKHPDVLLYLYLYLDIDSTDDICLLPHKNMDHHWSTNLFWKPNNNHMPLEYLDSGSLIDSRATEWSRIITPSFHTVVVNLSVSLVKLPSYSIKHSHQGVFVKAFCRCDYSPVVLCSIIRMGLSQLPESPSMQSWGSPWKGKFHLWTEALVRTHESTCPSPWLAFWILDFLASPHIYNTQSLATNLFIYIS